MSQMNPQDQPTEPVLGGASPPLHQPSAWIPAANRNLYGPPPACPPPVPPKRKSALGIASFVLSLITLVTLLGTLGIDLFGELHETAGTFLLMGGLGVFITIGSLAAFAMGITGCFQPSKRNKYAIMGTVISGLIVVLEVVVFLICVNMHDPQDRKSVV